MKYRELTDLTDAEIQYIVREMFAPKEIQKIIRNCKWQTVDVVIVTDGWSDANDTFSITDTVMLSVPSSTDDGIDVDMAINAKTAQKWRWYCIAKGCNADLKNNPYLFAEN